MTIKTKLDRIEDIGYIGQAVLTLQERQSDGLQDIKVDFLDGTFDVAIPVKLEEDFRTQPFNLYDIGVSIEQPPVAVTPAVADLLAEYEQNGDLTFEDLLDKAIDLYRLNTHCVERSNLKQDAFFFIADIIRYGYTPDDTVRYQIKSPSLPKGLQYFCADGDTIKLTDDDEVAWLTYDELKKFNLVELLRKSISSQWMTEFNDYEFTLEDQPRTFKQPTISLFNRWGKTVESDTTSSSESTVDSIFCEPLSDTIDPTEC
jgi:hypothetical protein